VPSYSAQSVNAETEHAKELRRLRNRRYYLRKKIKAMEVQSGETLDLEIRHNGQIITLRTPITKAWSEIEDMANKAFNLTNSILYCHTLDGQRIFPCPDLKVFACDFVEVNVATTSSGRKSTCDQCSFVAGDCFTSKTSKCGPCYLFWSKCTWTGHPAERIPDEGSKPQPNSIANQPPRPILPPHERAVFPGSTGLSAIWALRKESRGYRKIPGCERREQRFVIFYLVSVADEAFWAQSEKIPPDIRLVFLCRKCQPTFPLTEDEVANTFSTVQAKRQKILSLEAALDEGLHPPTFFNVAQEVTESKN